MAAPKRTPDQIAFDRAFVSRHYLEGKTQSQIARMLAEQTNRSVTQQQISYDLNALRTEWKQERLRNTDELVAEELAFLKRLEIMYFDEWYRSRENAEDRSTSLDEPVLTEATQGGGLKSAGRVGRRRSSITTKERLGAVQYLAGIHWCRERRAKLLGLDQPDKLDLTGDVSLTGYLKEPITPQEWDDAQMKFMELVNERRRPTPLPAT